MRKGKGYKEGDIGKRKEEGCIRKGKDVREKGEKCGNRR